MLRRSRFSRGDVVQCLLALPVAVRAISPTALRVAVVVRFVQPVFTRRTVATGRGVPCSRVILLRERDTPVMLVRGYLVEGGFLRPDLRLLSQRIIYSASMLQIIILPLVGEVSVYL